MYPIVKKRVLNETVTLMEIEAPLVAGSFTVAR
jgi:ferredoxin--NADP+ reductase